ncbi:hypothetical protein [Marivita sp.]|uniref:hypothetical protein n=1 Tax=Marivita sp. TaxID=2003365 RepID=UPI003A8483F7
MALDLSTLTAQQQLAAIYIGYYDRAADPVGEDFWESAVANPNLSLADIATDFATQPETLIAYPFLSDPTAEEAAGFIAEVFLNLFNRAPDAAGLEFWSGALLASIAGDEGALSVGEIILAIIEGAQDSAEGNDRTTILNKIEVATSWTDAADAAGIDYATDTGAQASAKSIIEGVTDEGSTVAAAKSTIDDFFDPAPVPGEEFLLTSATDRITGTDADDEFNAYIQQNPFAGGISNSLSSADRIDGGAGNDRLYAELTFEFLGTNNIAVTDIQPRISGVEEIDIEARDFGFGGGEDSFTVKDSIISLGGEDGPDIIVDAKNIVDHVEIGSYFSDGDLTIENLTTLTSSGAARNTSEITITMDHTDNFNTDKDASDLKVLFDNDYLLSGQESQGQIFYFLLDEDAELAGNPNRLNNIDVDGIRFTIDRGNGPVEVNIEASAANVAGTHQGFVNALQAPLQALIQNGTLPAGTTLTLDPTITDVTFLDNGAQSDLIPAIVLTSGDGSPVIATGFSRIEEEIGEYDVYGRFNSINEVADQPISIDIDLHKVGRGGEGGDLIIGGKDEDTADGIADGIAVFNINVLGAGNEDPSGKMTKPSSLGTVTSTGNELRIVNIATDPVYAVGDTFASLEIRDGFNAKFSGSESGDLQLVNADAFLGDLMLGTYEHIINLDTLTAQGGGDVSFYGELDGNETNQAYSYTTGGGDDLVHLHIDGDATDYAESSVSISTGAGDDVVDIYTFFDDGSGQNEQLNQNILDNVMVDTGSGDDVYYQQNGLMNADVMLGSGNDTLYADGDNGGREIWAMNFDAQRVVAQGGLGNSSPDDLPGEQISYAYLGGATVTVTLSGAGINGNLAAGGGVMATDATGTDDVAPGADRLVDGFESNVTIGNDLINGNRYYGDQRDVNAAILEAINDHPVLGEALFAFIGANNTVVIRSLVPGAFEDVDLRVDIVQANLTGTAWTPVQTEARSVFSNSTLVVNSVASANTPTGEDLTTSAGADAYYDGLSARADTANNSMSAAVGELVSNTHTNGSAASGETDSVYDGGSGNDVLFLSTDSVAAAPLDFTTSSNNALMNGASNETVKLTGESIGNDSIFNFMTAGGTNLAALTAPAAPVPGFDGLDFLDVTAYLTSQTSPSGSSASTVRIATTLQYSETNTFGAATGDGAGDTDINANEVAVIRFDNTGPDAGETFNAMTAANVAALFGTSQIGTDNAYGDLAQTVFDLDFGLSSTALVNGAAKAVLMIENADNLGQYKVFELSWNGAAADQAAAAASLTVNLLGQQDFGDSLTNLDDVNLVGSADHAALLTVGFV